MCPLCRFRFFLLLPSHVEIFEQIHSSLKLPRIFISLNAVYKQWIHQQKAQTFSYYKKCIYIYKYCIKKHKVEERNCSMCTSSTLYHRLLPVSHRSLKRYLTANWWPYRVFAHFQEGVSCTTVMQLFRGRKCDCGWSSLFCTVQFSSEFYCHMMGNLIYSRSTKTQTQHEMRHRRLQHNQHKKT